jgi:beta-galactosidase
MTNRSTFQLTLRAALACVILCCVLCQAVYAVGRGTPRNDRQKSAPTFHSQVIDVPDTGWHLWLDRKADWKNETAYLPGDAPLSKMDVHPPTGGWTALNDSRGINVTLPTTVEQHFWGATGLRPYSGEYFYESSDSQPLNGNYLGASWWWKTILIPADYSGKSVILHIRAAKQRAELFVNRQFVGYSMIGETAFDSDISRAIKPGEPNTIAIRITNSGGRLDWGDWGTAKIGSVSFYAGHGFSGLDRAITISAHGPVRFTDSWILNHPDPYLVTANADLTNAGSIAESGRVVVSVLDRLTGKQLASNSLPSTVDPNGDAHVSIPIRVPAAKLWDLDHPNLYTMRFEFVGNSIDTRDTTFGFRWFGPSGVGTNAVLRLNGERIRVYSAISWGFYGVNGLWPTPELADKEVRVAKSIGLNAINFHRNIARAESLDAADRLGLLRYTEPGGGMTLFWDKNSTTDSLQRYMTDKIAGMVRDARSHPSLMLYVIQNELDDNSYQHPLAPIILRMVHQLDPSRCVILKSGINAPGEMWMAPYDNTLYSDDGSGYSGWWDSHSVGYPDSWTDSDYKSPTDHVYINNDKREIVDYGEMGGSGAADNHALMIKQIEAAGGQSYDLLDHQQIDNAYNQFLSKWGFRNAFPTTSDLYQQIGAKQYEYWRNVIQCARLSDASDYLTISGWETTAIEDHGGLVDNLRNPHGDPAVIHSALLKLQPAIQLIESSVIVGHSVSYDLYFLNETDQSARGTLKVTLASPTATITHLGSYAVPEFKADDFVYPIAAGLKTPILSEPGDYTVSFSLGTIGESRTIHAIDLPAAAQTTIGLIGGAQIGVDLDALSAHYESFDNSRQYHLAIASSGGTGSIYHTESTVYGTPDPALYQNQCFGRAADLALTVADLPNGPAKVTLGFAETYFDSAGSRIFDVDVNGRPSLRDLDIYQLAGGKNKVWTVTVDAQVANGRITIAPGTVKADNAMFDTIHIQTPTKTISYYFGSVPYTAKDGTVWQPYTAPININSDILNEVHGGMNLLVIADNDDYAEQVGKELASVGALKFDGLVGRSRAPWMGCWYFVRANPMYVGLPVNTVMKGDYQVSVGSSNGMVVDGRDVQIFTGYSRDHSRTIGAGDFSVRYGLGTIVVHCVPSMNDAFELRWLDNTIGYLAEPVQTK